MWRMCSPRKGIMHSRGTRRSLTLQITCYTRGFNKSNEFSFNFCFISLYLNSHAQIGRNWGFNETGETGLGDDTESLCETYTICPGLVVSSKLAYNLALFTDLAVIKKQIKWKTVNILSQVYGDDGRNTLFCSAQTKKAHTNLEQSRVGRTINAVEECCQCTTRLGRVDLDIVSNEQHMIKHHNLNRTDYRVTIHCIDFANVINVCVIERTIQGKVNQNIGFTHFNCRTLRAYKSNAKLQTKNISETVIPKQTKRVSKWIWMIKSS